MTCKWNFTLKCHLDGTVTRHNARIVGSHMICQTYCIDYTKAFSSIVCIHAISVLLSLVFNKTGLSINCMAPLPFSTVIWMSMLF